MFVEFVDEGADAVIPELDQAVVERSENPRTSWMKGESFDPVRFCLELEMHFYLLLF